MPSGADNLTLPTTFYRGAVSDSTALASEASVRRSRRERALRLYGAALFAGDAAIWLLVIVSLSLSLPGLQPANHLPTISLISLPLLCIASVLYSINGYARNADMQSLEFTSTYLIGIVVAFCLSVAAVYFLGTFGDETQPPHSPPAVLCAFRAIVSPYPPCARSADGKIDREKGRVARNRLRRGRRAVPPLIPPHGRSPRNPLHRSLCGDQ
jgi:hypothetical protein